MKIKIRKSEERGIIKIDWLDGKYGFSFGNYYNPDNLRFGKLLVFNDDFIKAGRGFGTHHHDNAEVVSIILKGELIHKDSQGNEGIIRPGEVQRMSAGRSINHSEHASPKGEVHSLQIWLEPRELDTKPSYEKRAIKAGKDKFTKIVSGKKEANTVYINQDVEFYMGDISKGKKIEHKTGKKYDYLFVIEGKIILEKIELSTGDSAEITDSKNLSILAKENSSILLIEMAD